MNNYNYKQNRGPKFGFEVKHSVTVLVSEGVLCNSMVKEVLDVLIQFVRSPSFMVYPTVEYPHCRELKVYCACQCRVCLIVSTVLCFLKCMWRPQKMGQK